MDRLGGLMVLMSEEVITLTDTSRLHNIPTSMALRVVASPGRHSLQMFSSLPSLPFFISPKQRLTPDVYIPG